MYPGNYEDEALETMYLVHTLTLKRGEPLVTLEIIKEVTDFVARRSLEEARRHFLAADS